MSINYELLRNMYPEWESQTHPVLTVMKIFLAIAVFLVVPYVYIKFIEKRLAALLQKIKRIGASLHRTTCFYKI